MDSFKKSFESIILCISCGIIRPDNKLLPCFHSMCVPCLIKLWKRGNPRTDTRACPACSTTIPKHLKDMETWYVKHDFIRNLHSFFELEDFYNCEDRSEFQCEVCDSDKITPNRNKLTENRSSSEVSECQPVISVIQTSDPYCLASNAAIVTTEPVLSKKSRTTQMKSTDAHVLASQSLESHNRENAIQNSQSPRSQMMNPQELGFETIPSRTRSIASLTKPLPTQGNQITLHSLDSQPTPSRSCSMADDKTLLPTPECKPHVPMHESFFMECVQCLQSMCNCCAEKHVKMTTSTSHCVHTYGDSSPANIIQWMQSQELTFTNCIQHPSRKNQVYCELCKTPCCLLCLKKHESHPCRDLNICFREKRKHLNEDFIFYQHLANIHETDMKQEIIVSKIQAQRDDANRDTDVAIHKLNSQFLKRHQSRCQALFSMCHAVIQCGNPVEVLMMYEHLKDVISEDLLLLPQSVIFDSHLDEQTRLFAARSSEFTIAVLCF